MTIEQLLSGNYSSKSRNKLIAKAFKEIDLIEQFGSGFIRVRREIANYPTMKFQYKNAGYGFIAEFRYIEQKVSNKKSAEKSAEKIFDIIKNNSHITISEICAIVNMSERGVRNNINLLKREGHITRIGGRKIGHWQINDKKE